MRPDARTRRVPKAVFFDLFGTLARTPGRRRLAQFLGSGSGPSGSDDIELCLAFGASGIVARAIGADPGAVRDQRLRRILSLEESVALLVGSKRGAVPPEVLQTAEQCQQALNAACRSATEAVAVLRALRAVGTRTAIVTNADSMSLSVAETLDLAREVDVVVASCEVGATKPDPAIFATAAERLGVTPDVVVVIGDSWRQDVVGARRFGASAIWLDPGNDPIGRLTYEHRHSALMRVAEIGKLRPEALQALESWRLPPDSEDPPSRIQRARTFAGVRRALSRLGLPSLPVHGGEPP